MTRDIGRRLSPVFKYAVIVVIIFGLLITVSNYKELKRQLLSTAPVDFIVSVCLSFLVYIIEGLFLFIALRFFQEKIPIFTAIKCSFVINAIGYLVSFGGITQFTTQIHILDYIGVGARKSALIRILQVIFFGIFFDVILLITFIILLVDKEFSTALTIPVYVVTVVTILIIALFYCTVILPGFRETAVKAFVSVFTRFRKLLSKKKKPGEIEVNAFLDEFRRGFSMVAKNPLLLMKLTAITLIDYTALMSVMYVSFRAVGYAINPWHLIMGVTIGLVIGTVSMIPGGFGALEGSLALIYAALGVSVDVVLSAALLYRMAFNVIPFLFSIPLYVGMKHKDITGRPLGR
ncbi:MAG: flippase-like domain-containing protein [Spirochaetes bacterium]|nr:flippase-like domain-containing protein [Spirochaetota bacterium]